PAVRRLWAAAHDDPRDRRQANDVVCNLPAVTRIRYSEPSVPLPRHQGAAMRLLVGLTAALAIAAPLGAQQSTPGERLPVVKYVLPNGMTFLFLRREGAPTVAFVTHFRAGGVAERTACTPRTGRRASTPRPATTSPTTASPCPPIAPSCGSSSTATASATRCCGSSTRSATS